LIDCFLTRTAVHAARRSDQLSLIRGKRQWTGTNGSPMDRRHPAATASTALKTEDADLGHISCSQTGIVAADQMTLEIGNPIAFFLCASGRKGSAQLHGYRGRIPGARLACFPPLSP
jgi:hypothetical protein